MSILRTLHERREEILAAAADYGASNVRVFGSVARGEAGEDSDLDLLVVMEENRSLLDLIGLSQKLQELLRCEVDIVTEAGLSPYLRPRILREVSAL